MSGEQSPCVVWLIEDNPGDARLVREAIVNTRAAAILCVFDDGRAALDELRAAPAPERSPRPNLILLDLNLPRFDGRSVLGEIKKDPKSMHIPVVVWTSSDAPQDVRICYELHANGYVKKPGRLDGLMTALKSLVEFWARVAILPAD
jgi:CheY-like chemotaxis protein